MNAPATPASELLALWERAASARPAERDEALLGAVHDAPPVSAGARNALLLALRARLFGSAQSLRADCPRCGAIAEFCIDCEALSQTLLPASDAVQPQLLEAAGHRVEFRLPDIGDVREASRFAASDAAFTQILLDRCVIRCEAEDGSRYPPRALPASVVDALSRRMEELEPGASVGFELTCPECAESWSAAMNVAEVLWSELKACAERLLTDVDALARAYGWSETEVLTLTPTRRAAYLQMVGAG